jgi:hypothetical protein
VGKTLGECDIVVLRCTTMPSGTSVAQARSSCRDETGSESYRNTALRKVVLDVGDAVLAEMED